MFSLFTSRKTRPANGAAGRRRLRFESLEQRRCLSVVPGDPSFIGPLEAPAVETEALGLDLGGAIALGGPIGGGPPPNAPPTIDGLTIAYNGQRSITISGRVSDEQPGGLTVQFSGAWSGSAVTESDGSFSVTTSDAQLGELDAVTHDQQGLESLQVWTAVSSQPPVITDFNTEVSPTNLLEVWGAVTDEDVEGLTVEIVFLGVTYSTSVTSDGAFYWTRQLQEGEEGWLTATAVDWWGLRSNTCEDLILPV